MVWEQVQDIRSVRTTETTMDRVHTTVQKNTEVGGGIQTTVATGPLAFVSCSATQ